MLMWIILIVLIIILLIIAYFKVGDYFYNIALNPKTDKDFVLSKIPLSESEQQYINERIEWLGATSEDVYITSTNNGNLKLHAYELKSTQNSDIWAIVIHGYMAKGKQMVGYAEEFNKRGYNVLVLDLRGHGLSEGDYVGMGWDDRLDVIDWINYILQKNPQSKIILFGISMGAATTMMATGEKLPSNVKLAIEDCGYSSVWDEFSHQLKKLFKLPEFPVLYAADSSCKRKAKYSFKKASSVEQLKKSNTPTLFIHGSVDEFVPFKMLDVVYNAATCKKEKLVIEGAGHGGAWTENPTLYWETIDKFINKYIEKGT